MTVSLDVFSVCLCVLVCVEAFTELVIVFVWVITYLCLIVLFFGGWGGELYFRLSMCLFLCVSVDV